MVIVLHIVAYSIGIIEIDIYQAEIKTRGEIASDKWNRSSRIYDKMAPSLYMNFDTVESLILKGH